MLGGQTQLFEVRCLTGSVECIFAFFVLTAAAVCAFGSVDNFFSSHFIDVGILVGAEQDFFAACHVGMAFCIAFIDSGLDFAIFHSFGESAFGFYAKEQFPCFGSY